MRAHHRRPLAALVALAATLTVAACERSRQAPPVDTAAPLPPPPPPPVDSAAVSTLDWEADAGPALFVPGASPQQALVVFPEFTDSTLTDTTSFDAARVGGVTVELFARAGTLGTAQLAQLATARPAAGTSCTAWPVAQLTAAGAGVAPARAWTVGFSAGHAKPIPLDSIEGLPPADSARLAVDVTRLAAALPADTASAFAGIPFVVRAARRFSPVAGVEAVVAQVVRKVSEEARPREEQILVIGERPVGSKGKLTPAYFERVSGHEETVETADPLAAVLLGPERTPTLVLARDYGDGLAYSFLERTGPGEWHLRWSSAYAGC